MRYVEARVDEYHREEAYRIYVTKSLQLAPQEQYIQSSYTDLISDMKPHKEQTGDEIAVDVITKAGLKFR